MGLTRKKDLRGGKAVWTQYRNAAVRGTRLLRSTRAEVVIVGAGISGALLAQALTDVGVRPLLIDRRRAALLGSTAASTALLQFELDTPLIKLTKVIGASKAKQAWVASRDAVNELRTRASRLGIRAQLHSRPSLYLAGDVLDAKGLAQETKLRQKAGLASELLTRQALLHHFGIKRDCAILNHGNAEANPVELAAGFLRRALQSGARLHSPHDIVDLQCSRHGTTLLTHDGLEILARHVVFCTGYEMPKIVPQTDNRIMSTWAIATRAQPTALWRQKALIWEASEPYLYLRTTFDGRVICGGEDEAFSDAEKRDSALVIKAARLEMKLSRIFPALDPQAKLSWAGSFGSSPNGMPTIGVIPGYRRCYAVMGFGGNGITFSMLASGLIADAIRGRKNKLAPIFAFQ